MNVYDDLLRALRDGWRPFRGHVDGSVYGRLDCRRSSRARWLTRDDAYLCLGCDRRCAVADGDGMQRALPVDTPLPDLGPEDLPYLTAAQMLHAFEVFKVAQLEYILNLSRAEVYRCIADGRLEKVSDRPVRVSKASVLAALGRDQD